MGEGEIPKAVQNLERQDKIQVFRTHGITLTLSNLDDKKGVTLKVENPTVQRPLTMTFSGDGIEINNNNETIAKLTANTIELIDRQSSTIVIKPDSIQLKEKAVETTLTPTAIELKNTPTTAKLTTAAFELKTAPSTAKLTASGVEINSAAAKLKVAPSGTEIANGAATIKLSPISVNVNNGALEVT